MKNLKILAFGAALMIGFTGMAQQQNAKAKKEMHDHRHEKMTPEQRAEKRTQHMTEKLELNADQQAKVKDLHLRMAKQREELRSNETMTREEKKAAMIASHDAYKVELRQILTPEQYEKYQEWEAQKKERMEKRREMHKDQKGKKSSEMEEELEDDDL